MWLLSQLNPFRALRTSNDNMAMYFPRAYRMSCDILLEFQLFIHSRVEPIFQNEPFCFAKSIQDRFFAGTGTSCTHPGAGKELMNGWSSGEWLELGYCCALVCIVVLSREQLKKAVICSVTSLVLFFFSRHCCFPSDTPRPYGKLLLCTRSGFRYAAWCLCLRL